MAQIDKVKEEIGWLKVIFAILIASDISLIAWLIQNYGNANRNILIIGGVVAIGVTCAIIWLNRTVSRKINKLEDL